MKRALHVHGMVRVAASTLAAVLLFASSSSAQLDFGSTDLPRIDLGGQWTVLDPNCVPGVPEGRTCPDVIRGADGNPIYFDATGTTAYDGEFLDIIAFPQFITLRTSTGAVESAAVFTFFEDTAPDPSCHSCGTFRIRTRVASNGVLVPVNDGQDDFSFRGGFGVSDGQFAGTLVTGKVVDFGYVAVPGQAPRFKFRVAINEQLSVLAPYYRNDLNMMNDLGVEITSENSNFPGHFGSPFSGDARKGVAIATSHVAPLPLPPPGVIYTARIQSPIDANGSSVFKAKRGVVPVKFKLAANGVATCKLPAATISLTKTVDGVVFSGVNESEYLHASDSGSNFRIDSGDCQYIYNLGTKSLGVGTYVVRIHIDLKEVGSGTFALK